MTALLKRLNASKLILTSLTSHQCVLFTVVDAYVRDFDLYVPRDCIGAPSAVETRHALHIINTALKAKVAVSSSLRL